jgi:hypothetical protein
MTEPRKIVLFCLCYLAVGVGIAAPLATTTESGPPAAARPPVALLEEPRDPPPLPTGALARLGSIHLRHGGAVACLAFAPDGKTLA